jgi:PAS domain S-box-containing protein
MATVPERSRDNTKLLQDKREILAGESTFRVLADAAPVMLWASGPDPLRTYFNRPWLEFRGQTREHELGRGWSEGIHPDDRDLCLAGYWKAFQARQVFRLEYRLQCANGEYRWVVDTGIPCYDGEGFRGFIGSASVTTRPITPEDRAISNVSSLTRRERQVLALIAEGKSTKEVAADLGIAFKTADAHRNRIYQKLDIHGIAAAVRYAIRTGIVTL